MSAAAVVLCKDERDVIEPLARHLAANVDELYVTDNGSTDGTLEILEALRAELPLTLIHDPEPGHYQGRKTTAMAMRALEAGHRWVAPCDADEIWIAPEGRTISDWLDGLGREHQFVKAAIYNHVATAKDPPAMVGSIEAARALAEAQILGDATVIRPEPNPFKRIGYRQRSPLDIRWGKVACRLRPDLEIGEGNHDARTHGVGTTGYGLEIRHFPYRSAEHFVAKAVKGLAALEATDLDEGTGAHWRAYGQAVREGGPEAGVAWFYDAFYSENPEADDSLVYDPVTPYLRG